MSRRANAVQVVVLVATLAVTGAMLRTGVAQKEAAPKPQDKLALGEEEVKQLLLLNRHRKEGQDLQARMDDFHGGGVRQTGQDTKRRAGRQGTDAVEIASKPLHECGKVTGFRGRGRTLRVFNVVTVLSYPR